MHAHRPAHGRTGTFTAGGRFPGRPTIPRQRIDQPVNSVNHRPPPHRARSHTAQPAGRRSAARRYAFRRAQDEIGSLLQVSVLHVAEIPQRCPAAREIRQFSPVATHLLAFLTDVPYQRPPAAADGPTRCSRFGSGSVRLVTTSDDFAAKAGHKRRAQELLLR